MHLSDNKDDSILVYADWLEDEGQYDLAVEVRDSVECYVNYWHYPYFYVESGVGCDLCSDIGCDLGSDIGCDLGVGGHSAAILEGVWCEDFGM